MIDPNLLPQNPGVYLFKDREGRVLYIGKAKNIRERIKSYLRGDSKNLKTARLMKKVCFVEPIITSSEKEAFLLENNLIKEYSPPYNINLKDDKTYISIKITLLDEYPALYITRKVKEDGSVYFGPYPHASNVREILRLIQGIYPIRRCKNSLFKKRERPCILYQIKKCLGPCSGLVDKEEYMEAVRGLIDFLSGKEDRVLKDIEEKIRKCAKNWQFEEAQALKEKYMAIKDIIERQNVHIHFGKNRDVWAFAVSDGVLHCVVLSFQKGVLIGKKTYKYTILGEYTSEQITSLLFQYYSYKPIPDEILISEEAEGLEVLKEFLSEKAKKEVLIHKPKEGESFELISLALENLQSSAEIPLDVAFMKHLHLSRRPRRIEIYDCSHLFGKDASASMVVFEDFKMKKEDYRVFNIKGENPMDDISSIREVLLRRIKDTSLGPLPDLFVVDGGRAHLLAAKKTLEELQIEADIIGIAKGRNRKRMEDHIYLPGRKNPLYIPKSSLVFKELVKMRDEAHRFALFSHRRKRKHAYGR